MPNFKRSSLAVFRAQLARASVSPIEALDGLAFWPRFARSYRALARLPRKARRALDRRWRPSLGSLALLLALAQAPVLAATINVDGGCTLVDAITAANTDIATGSCTAGSGADTLVLAVESTHLLSAVQDTQDAPTGLPRITSAITIEGNGSTITRASNAPGFRIVAVAPPAT